MEKDRVAFIVTFILTVALNKSLLQPVIGKGSSVGVIEHSVIVSIRCWIRSVLQTSVF
jgi:hypothetical protein